VAHLQAEDGARIVLTPGGISVGRDQSNDVVLADDMRVSRSHAQISDRDGRWVVIDLDSKNGTFVNARPISLHPLRDDDEIRIGSSVWRFRSGPDPHATQAATDFTSQPRANLTDREVDILRLVSDGLTDKEIAQRLQISINTVRSHLDRIGEKTGLRKRSELTRLAVGLHLDHGR
jgi:DNA-binding CsgD family transcriptional regulator